MIQSGDYVARSPIPTGKSERFEERVSGLECVRRSRRFPMDDRSGLIEWQ